MPQDVRWRPVAFRIPIIASRADVSLVGQVSTNVALPSWRRCQRRDPPKRHTGNGLLKQNSLQKACAVLSAAAWRHPKVFHLTRARCPEAGSPGCIPEQSSAPRPKRTSTSIHHAIDESLRLVGDYDPQMYHASAGAHTAADQGASADRVHMALAEHTGGCFKQQPCL